MIFSQFSLFSNTQSKLAFQPPPAPRRKSLAAARRKIFSIVSSHLDGSFSISSSRVLIFFFRFSVKDKTFAMPTLPQTAFQRSTISR